MTNCILPTELLVKQDSNNSGQSSRQQHTEAWWAFCSERLCHTEDLASKASNDGRESKISPGWKPPSLYFRCSPKLSLGGVIFHKLETVCQPPF